MVIIGATYLDESVISSTAISASGDILSFSAGIHWVYVLQSTPESTILRASLYVFCSFRIFFRIMKAYLSFSSQH